MAVYLSQFGGYTCAENLPYLTNSEYIYSENINQFHNGRQDFEVTEDHVANGFRFPDCVGKQILFHHSICRSTSCPQSIVDSTLGKWEIRTVVSGGYLDKTPELDLEHFHVQAVWFVSADSFSGFADPDEINYFEQGYHSSFPYTTCFNSYSFAPNDDEYPCYGSIIAIKARNITFNGWRLFPFGISSSYYANYRPLTTQEQNGTLDSQARAGEENSNWQCMPLNVGDCGGLVFIIAENITFEKPSYDDVEIDTDLKPVSSRQDFTPYSSPNGIAGCRGATDDSNTPSGYSLVGGPNIIMVCKKITGFNPAYIAKYARTYSYNKGLSRCYIAVADKNNSDISQDGRLYYLDDLIERDPVVKKLRYRKGGTNHDITLSDTATGKALAVNTTDGIFYANLVDPAADNASDIRVRAGGQTYALANS